MTSKQKLQLEQSEKRQKINEFLSLDELTDDQRNELDVLTKRMQSLELELRAAIVVEGNEEEERGARPVRQRRRSAIRDSQFARRHDAIRLSQARLPAAGLSRAARRN